MSNQPDIGQITELARCFKTTVDRIKSRLEPISFSWYPYDSLTNFVPLGKCLKAERRFLLNLVGADPVVDLGCADGAVSFFMESLGCKVHAIDYASTNFNGMRGIRALREALHSSVEIYEVNLDTEVILRHGPYGLALCFGLLYHLKNPFLVLEALAQCTRFCLLSTRIARFTPDRRICFQAQPMAYLLDDREANNDPTNYWIFSETGLRRILDRTGWDLCDFLSAGNTTCSDPVGPTADERAFCALRSRHFD